MSSLEHAIALAAMAHAGQKDKAGAPYITHPLRVMDAVPDETAKIAAVLHDIVEDTPVTLKWLRDAGFSEEVLSAVEAVTKDPDDESVAGDSEEANDARYFAFVQRAARHPVGRAVKRADLLDNLDLTRIAGMTEKDRKRIARYTRALGILDAAALHGSAAQVPVILPLTNVVTAADVERAVPGSARIYACDFAIEGAVDCEEPGVPIAGSRILNVDHHANFPRMQSRVTSTELAYTHLRNSGGRIEAGSRVVINHADCDSVLSSAMLMGLIEVDERFVQAARAADHTGEEDPIADLLQALDDGRPNPRTEAHYLESIRNLRLLLDGKPLERVGQLAIDLRAARRREVRRLVESGTFTAAGEVSWGILDEPIDSAFLPALLPDAHVIMLATLLHAHPGRWIHKLRLGAGSPAGLTLHALGITWDENLGGRWNAGGNKRRNASGDPPGSAIHPKEYASRLRERLESWRATDARG